MCILQTECRRYFELNRRRQFSHRLHLFEFVCISTMLLLMINWYICGSVCQSVYWHIKSNSFHRFNIINSLKNSTKSIHWLIQYSGIHSNTLKCFFLFFIWFYQNHYDSNEHNQFSYFSETLIDIKAQKKSLLLAQRLLELMLLRFIACILLLYRVNACVFGVSVLFVDAFSPLWSLIFCSHFIWSHILVKNLVCVYIDWMLTLYTFIHNNTMQTLTG